VGRIARSRPVQSSSSQVYFHAALQDPTEPPIAVAPVGLQASTSVHDKPGSLFIAAI
jgi:hypothetical protein